MVILKLISGTTLSVDSTQITVDSTTLTVDLTTNTFSGFSFIFSAREAVSECEMIFFNELKETTQTVIGQCSEYRGNLLVTFSLDDVEESDSFQVTINDINGKLLCREKAFATSQNDLENYTMNKVGPNNKITL